MEQLITLNQVQTQSVYAPPPPPTTLKKLFHFPPSQTNTDLMADRIKGVLRMEATFKHFKLKLGGSGFSVFIVLYFRTSHLSQKRPGGSGCQTSPTCGTAPMEGLNVSAGMATHSDRMRIKVERPNVAMPTSQPPSSHLTLE